MSRKHYQAIAEAIAKAQSNEDFTAEQMANEIIFQIGQALKTDNGNFDIYKFAEACKATDI